MVLANKLIGALAVGKSRNGGQELVIQQIQSAMLCHEMVIVGGRHPSFQGGTLISVNDTIDGDEYGIASAKNLGRRVAEVSLMMN
jgi:multimeric flavodoxin WrbA